MDQELVQYLDERFNGIDRRFEAVDRRFDEVNERIDEVKRHNGVLIEGLRDEVHLLAEGLATHIEVHHRQEHEYFERKFADTHALIRSSYDHLNQRVENLERRGQG